MQFGDFFFDGDKKKIYEAPLGFSYTLDGDGYRIYTPDDEPTAPTQVQYSTYELWSRYVDYMDAIEWAHLAIAISGGAYRYTDQFGEDKYSLIDLRLLNEWAYVQTNYPHTTFIKGNIFGDANTDVIFDSTRITRQGVIPAVFYSDAGERSVADPDAQRIANENLVYASFSGAVWIDVTSPWGDVGTETEPNGTPERPVNNIPLAVQIANDRGFREIQVIGNLTLDTGDDVQGFKLIGTSHVNAFLTVNTGALTLKTSFESFDISGVLDGSSEITNCVVGDIEYFNGHIHDSALRGTIILAGNKTATISDCNMFDIEAVPVIDCNISGQNLIMTNWTGRLIISNSGVDNLVGLGCDAGDIYIDSTCVGGSIAISGTGEVIDDSTDDCYVINKIVDGTELANLHRVIEYLRPHHTGSGEVWYWNPYSGNDAWHGDAPDRGFKTFAKAHEMAGNANHDTIIIVPADPTGITTITEAVSITKDYLFLRGPGRDVIIQHSVDVPTSISTTARGTELSGFRISNTTPNSVAIHSTGVFTLCENLWIENTANGFLMNEHHPLIHSCKIHGATGYAIKMEGVISHGEIYDVTAGDAGETTIQINTTADSGGIKMRDSIVVGSTGYGVSLSASTRKFVAESSNTVKYNTLGDFNDLGTENVTTNIVETVSSGNEWVVTIGN